MTAEGMVMLHAKKIIRFRNQIWFAQDSYAMIQLEAWDMAEFKEGVSILEAE